MVTIKSFATDEPSSRDYPFDEYRKVKEENTEYSEWTPSGRPREKSIVFNQYNTPACTAFSDGHIYNWNNIIENERLWENREQKNPNIFWDAFCLERNNFNTGTSIQTMALWYKKKLLIEWFVTITNGVGQIDKIKRAIDAWYRISTGSNNWNWTKTKNTGIYTLRTDKKIVWHAFAIVDYEQDFFWAINSYGNKWGLYEWYFKIPFTLIDKIYSKLVIIDKNDSKTFQKFKDRIRVNEIITLAKMLYNNWNSDVRKYFENIQLSKNLDILYK